MKKLLGLIFNRTVLVLLGLAAIALLVWLVGPLVAVADVRPLETPRARLVLIALLLGAYIVRRLWKLLAARRANAGLLDAMLARHAEPVAAAPAAGAAEVALLEQRFAQAADVLKKARFGRQGERAGQRAGFLVRFTSQWLYELPWYLLVGSPGSGKTTALANSGLQFPLAEQMGLGPVGGVGGTRNCDWWFSNDAVLLDTAGRYTTQDSDRAADSAAWTGFLRLLARYRRRRPINGVLLTLSAAELLEQTPAQRGAQLEALRTRIEELHRELGIRFPLYVLVTKTDLLAGFTDFFAGLTTEERNQVWGATRPYGERREPVPGGSSGADSANFAVDFAADFAALEERLNARLIDRMEQERDLERRARLYVFPQQFAALRQSLQEFLAALFAPSHYTEPVLLRGVYFTSATQNGTPIDRVLAGLGRALQLPGRYAAPQAGTGKSFFLTGLLKNVVFQEAGLGGVNLGWEKRRALVQWGALALALLLACAALAAWSLSYSRNRAYVERVAAARDAAAAEVAATASGGADLTGLLPVLAAVRQVAEVPGAAGKPPLSMDFGLYQGDKLQAAARQAYRTLLQDAFLPRLTARIAQQLRSDARSNPELLYEGLKAYLMLHDARHRDPAALKAYIAADWEARLGSSVAPAQRAALEDHLDALLEQPGWRPAAPPDLALIAAARDAIAHTPLAQRIYNRLQHQALGAGLPEFTIAGAAGPAAQLVFARASGAPLTRGVPGLYSVDGYRRAFAAASERVTAQLADEQPWVLGAAGGAELADPGARTRLLGEVRRLYLQDYARRWEEFIGDIALVHATSLQQSIELARVLSAPASPLPLLLRAIVKQVTLAAAPGADKSALDKAGERTRSARDELLELFGQERRAAPEAPVGAVEDVVDRRFDELRRLVQAAPGAPAPIDATLGLINELYTLLTATEAAVRSGNTPPPSEVPNRIRAEGSRMPEPVRSVLLGLSEGGASQAAGAARANLSQALQSGVLEYCSKAVAGRYPFSKESARDVTQEDFARLFAPGGVIDDFFQKNLAPYVNTTTRPWSFRDMGASSLGVNSGSLLQFQRAQAIRDVFFRPGSPLPGVRVELKPLDMDDSITRLVLDVDGQLIEYTHGAQVPKQVQWPGPGGSRQVRIELTPPGDGSVQVFEGPWALFRLFDQARIEGGAQPEQFVATFDVGGRKARFRVISGSVQNPFRLPELEQFQCPGRL